MVKNDTFEYPNPTAEDTKLAFIQEHLQRSLDSGTALKQTAASQSFEYTAVAFKPQLSSRRRNKSHADAYVSIEQVSGDERLLFEQPGSGVVPPRSNSSKQQQQEPEGKRKPSSTRRQQAAVTGTTPPAATSQAPPGPAASQHQPASSSARRAQRTQAAAPTATAPDTESQKPDPHNTQQQEARRFIQYAAQLLGMSPAELCRHRALRSYVQLLQRCPGALEELVLVLRQHAGMSVPQLRHTVAVQPNILYLKPAQLAARSAALAEVLELLAPSPQLAEAVAAAPDVLTRQGSLRKTRAALEDALLLGPQHTLTVLRGTPRLLYVAPQLFGESLAALQQHLGLDAGGAVQLALSDPLLLSTPPSVLARNASMLRRQCQVDAGQLAAMAALLPALLCRSPGELEASTRRLLHLLHADPAWRSGLTRLLGSPRNLLVALSFGSGRMDRLQYLHTTGRARFMGFKDALSIQDEDFDEVFPEYRAWRKAQKR